MVLCGLMLWKAPFGEAWVNASYDHLFRFGTHAITNEIVLIQMDNEAYDQFNQTRGQPWDRALHTQLLNRLADDGCAVVVFDVFFRSGGNSIVDKALADAMKRQRGIALMAEQAQVTHPDLIGARPILPAKLFLNAAGETNWGVAWLDPDLDGVVRRHWPFPSAGPYPSLPRTAARLAGARLDDLPQERWIRYYGRDGAWTRLSYRFALLQPPNFYRNKIVFIGTHPKTSWLDGEPDEFSTPYTHWTGETVGGVEILITSFLNRLNQDWLRRPVEGFEFLLLLIAGTVLGAGLPRWPLKIAFVGTIVAMALLTVGAIAWSYFTNYWFPWLVIAGGQAPCALAWAFILKLRRAAELTKTAVADAPEAPLAAPEPLPEIAGYELFPKPFGEGAYGKVWLAKDRDAKWHAVKVVYQARFNENTAPYDREFKGVSRYQPISDQHPGLLRVQFVSSQQNGYFYYIMELGDAVAPGWEKDPSQYKPRDLSSLRSHLPQQRLSTLECVSIGITLCDALEFLHQKGLTHRDIKPQNVIFVGGQPKLADVGLMAEIRPPDEQRTLVGTPGYMPPPPEVPGTPAADIYSLGMVLYVLSTGGAAGRFPEVSSTLIETRSPVEFRALNGVILKACQPNAAERFASAREMQQALRDAQQKIEQAVSQLALK